MGLYRRRQRPQPEPQRSAGPISWADWASGRIVTSPTGVAVSSASALQSDAAWACVDIIAGSISQFPVAVVERGMGWRRPIEPPVVVADPSAALDQMAWVYAVVSSWLRYGNVYGEVREIGGRRAELLDPARCSWDFSAGTETLLVDGRPRDLWPVGDIWHVPAYAVAGSRVGLNPVQWAARNPIASGLAAAAYGDEFFGAGGHPTGIWSTDEDIDEEQAAQAKRRFATLSKRGNREPIVVGSAWKYTRVQASPQETQFLDLQAHALARVARIYRVPLEMVGAAVQGSSLTYANLAERQAGFVAFTLGFWMRRLELGWSQLIDPGLTVKVNPGAFLRGDLVTQTKVISDSIRAGVLTPNEGRELLDREPFADGDAHLWPPYTVAPSAPLEGA